MGKVRIKERAAFSDYGIPVPPTKTLISHKHYAEWQIGYDKVAQSGEKWHFIGANDKKKCIYELSEILEFGLKNGLFSKNELENLHENIQKNEIFVDEKEKISRTNFTQDKINGVEFLKSSVSYPLLVHKFSDKNALCEIIVREKQFAVGTMPMLYFCVALSALKDKNGGVFVGRTIKSNESGFLEISRENIAIFVQMFKIFGILSKTHKHDVLRILEYLLG